VTPALVHAAEALRAFDRFAKLPVEAT